MSTSYNPSPLFHEAAAYLSSASSLSAVTNAIKLELYAIFKYLTVSPTPNVPKPSLFDFAGKAKWDAWKSAGDTYKDRPADAEARYIEIAKSLGWTEGSMPEAKHPVSKEENTRNEGAVDGNDEEDIWDKSDDEGVRKERSGESAMGRITSTMVTEDTGNANALSNIAIVGDAEGLLEYLQSHPDANVNALDENGYTPLHLAADRGHTNIVEILLERGADTSVKDEDEYTAKELAEIAGHDGIVSLLSRTETAPS